MQKQTINKKIMICAAAAVLIVAAAATALFLFRGDEAFRSIMVYELAGSAVIDRVEIGTIDAAENLYLESGDRVSVAAESMMRMKLDDDKYVTAEADTVFVLEAEGDGENSRTRIRLEQGAVTNEIQKPLGGEDLYETTTPNSVMAVRGTIYRVQLCDNGAGGQDMRLCCFDGTVAAKPIFPDGTYGEEVLVHAGCELTVYSDGTVAAVQEIDFESLPKQALEVLGSLLESGAPVTGITADALNDFITVAGDAGEETGSDRADETEGTDLQAASGISEGSEEDTKAGMDEGQAVRAGEDADGQNLAAGQNKGKTDQAKSGSAKKESDTGKDGEPATGRDPGESGTPAAGSGSSGGENTGNSNSNGSGSNNGSSGNNGSGGGDSDKPSNDGNSGDDSQDKKPGDDSGSKPNPPKETSYTVTYEYQGTVFATQTVKSGKKAVAPVLAPAAEGAWDFDFDTKIKADTTIQWKP